MTREACRRVAGIMDGIPLPVLIVDAQARMIGANPAAEALFGPNLLDRPFVTVIRHPAVLQALDRVLAPDRHPAPPPDPVLPTPPEGGAVLRAQIAADRHVEQHEDRNHRRGQQGAAGHELGPGILQPAAAEPGDDRGDERKKDG